MKKKLLIEPHYLGSLEYYVLLYQHDKIIFEVNDSFSKQTFRNRALFLGANKILPLIVPLSYSNNTPTQDVKVDFKQRWVKDHWGALYSSYGKAPFYDYFSEEFKSVWDKKQVYLIDLLHDFFLLIEKLIQANWQFSLTKVFQNEYPEEYLDCRNLIQPKIHFSNRNIYQSIAYTQLFGDSFVSNLSIVDLIMCKGPEVGKYLTRSYKSEAM